MKPNERDLERAREWLKEEQGVDFVGGDPEKALTAPWNAIVRSLAVLIATVQQGQHEATAGKLLDRLDADNVCDCVSACIQIATAAPPSMKRNV